MQDGPVSTTRAARAADRHPALRRTNMDRHRETFSTCARLLLIGLLASCASLDSTDTGSAAAAAADNSPRVAEDHAAFAVTEQGPVRGTCLLYTSPSPRDS